VTALVRRVASAASAGNGAGNGGEPQIAGLVAGGAGVASENSLGGAASPFARWWRERLPTYPPPRPPASDAVAARAAALLRFAEEAFAALAEREPDAIEEAERAAAFGGGEGGPRHGVSVTEENFERKGVTP
jgi:hypothetical protein